MDTTSLFVVTVPEKSGDEEVRSMVAEYMETNSDLFVNVHWSRNEGKEDAPVSWQVSVPVTGPFVSKVFNELMDMGIGTDFGMINILPITVSKIKAAPVGSEDVDVDVEEEGTTEPVGKTASKEGAEFAGSGDEAEKNEEKQKANQLLESAQRSLAVETVVEQTRAQAQFSFDFVLLVLIASSLAGIGLATDSVVVVISSMLVSPIMGPILAGTFGTVIRDAALVKLGVISELKALAVCVAVGFLIGLVMAPVSDTWGWPTNEMKSRGELSGLAVGVAIALPSGVGVALSILGNNTNSLVGVAISASLLPPAVNAGLNWAYAAVAPSLRQGHLVCPAGAVCALQPGMPANTTLTPYEVHNKFSSADSLDHFRIGGFSFLLTVVNIICVYFAALVMFKVKEVAPFKSKSQFWRQNVQEYRKFHRTLKGERGKDLQEAIKRWRERSALGRSGGTGGAGRLGQGLLPPPQMMTRTASDFMTMSKPKTEGHVPLREIFGQQQLANMSGMPAWNNPPQSPPGSRAVSPNRRQNLAAQLIAEAKRRASTPNSRSHYRASRTPAANARKPSAPDALSGSDHLVSPRGPTAAVSSVGGASSGGASSTAAASPAPSSVGTPSTPAPAAPPRLDRADE